MEIQYYKEPSRFLKREMEFKVFGHSGLPCLAFACEGGRFYDWEDHGMVAALAPLIDAGRIQLFCADSVDAESWMGSGEGRARSETQERWFNYLAGELIPRVLALNGGTHTRVALLGCSLGAGHALNLYLRRPELVCGAICLSGSYSAATWFGPYHDDLTLRNSPLEYPPLLHTEGLPSTRLAPLFLCCGRGPYEDDFLADTRAMAQALTDRRMPAFVDYWGEDVSHDWPWWAKQAVYFLPQLLQQLNSKAKPTA